MIRYDNKQIEEKICDLFLESIPIKHYKFRNIESKMYFFSETYLYFHFYRNIMDSSVKELNKRINYILRKNFRIKNSSDITLLKKLLLDVTNNSNDVRNTFSKSNQKRYKDLEKSIIRKLKIKMILK